MAVMAGAPPLAVRMALFGAQIMGIPLADRG